MRSKRLLTILIVLCMLISTLSPAVYAAQPAAGSENKFVTTEKASNEDSGLIVSPDAVAKVPTMKDDGLISSKVEAPETTGQWDITEIEDLGADLFSSDAPACLEELKEAAQYFKADEKVVAFVVLEDKPLAETYSNILDVAPLAEKKLLNQQTAVLSAIEEDVMDKEDELEVRYQFTYLTNAISIETQFENLAEIALLNNVKSVFVMPVYEAITTDAKSSNNPLTASSGEMTGVANVWADLGYTGTGMKIAIIDTGLDLDHPSFAADPETNENSMTTADIDLVLTDLNAYDRYAKLTSEKLYQSVKVPFAFNYCDENLVADHSSDYQGDHGTHVAGIAAANKLDGTSVVGMAPDAQIIVMKVFGASEMGAMADDIVAALEDAMTLGCDVVNASLGSPAGFASTDTEMDLIYERLASQDIIATYSAGNEGTSSYSNMWGTDLNRTDNPDNATVGSPSTYVNTLSIASAENGTVMTSYFQIADGSKIFYIDSIEYLYGETSSCLAGLAGAEYEYVIVPGLGAYDDFYDEEYNSIVEGKIAVVKRGELSFSEKVFNAENAGAVACIIWNNNPDDDVFSFGMTTATEDGMIPYIPSCLISVEDGAAMEAAETKTLTPSSELGAREANGGQMSSFSSWGVSPDLQLVPDITGIGGNVYSTLDKGNYGLMSGTSMSAPQVAGVSALVMEYLHELYPNALDGSIRNVAEALLMSTADPIIGSESGVEASPRQQGAGLVDALEAITTKAYLTVGGGRPKAEMGDNADGVFHFSFEIHNMDTVAKTYTLSSTLLTEECVDYQIGEYFMAGFDVALTGDVTFSKDTVTVPAGGKTNVTATVTLSDEDKAMFAQYWENGGYVEGYVYLTNEEGAQELNLPFLGFYGDWTEAPIFDTAYWYDNTFFGVNPVDGLPEGDQFYHVVWTDLAGSDWVLGLNPYSGAVLGEDGKVMYDPAHNAVSPNGDGVIDGLDNIWLSLLRNAKTLTLTYTVDGQVMQTETYSNVYKTMYQSSQGQVVPWLYSWYGDGMYDFTDANGNVLPDGTEVILTIEAKLDYASDKGESLVIPIIVDNEGAKLVDVTEELVDETASMTVEVSDNVEVAAVFVMNPNGTQIYGSAADVEMTENENGNMTVSFDVTGLGTELVICVADYAGNESYYSVTYTAAGENLPEMNIDALYAYRVHDNYIFSDHMFGWVELSKPASADEAANITAWTDDYLEFAAINAAEYAGGKIFAVDAVYNLVVMDPGLFNRKTITNIGVNVLDMTFDDSTDTMYVLTKENSYEINLYTMDLLTGELTLVKSMGYYYRNAPWTITDDDNGTLYATKYNSSNIFTIDAAGGTYEMTAVTDAEGNPIVFNDAYGEPLAPSNYSQSIAYLDGMLYWAYYRYSYWGGDSALVTINTADWTSYASAYVGEAYDAEGNLTEYYPTTELVGLLALKETDYELPESTEVNSVSLSAEELIMPVGTTSQLTASWLPWNYDLDESQLVWTSADETIATVADGVVTAVSEGETTITVSYGELTASCNITAVLIDGHFEAYNYYSGDGNYGYMIDVDMDTMDYTLVGDSSPIDFVAGDYNGHDGYFYGYDMGGQMYRYDYATGEAVALGTSLGTYPVDMAYDYSTGMMYVLVLDYNDYTNTLYAVNMSNGAMMNVASGYGIMNLAIDTEGNMYGMDMGGYLNQLIMQDASMYGGEGFYLAGNPLMEDSFGDLQMLQSICWDHNNDVLLWNWCEGATVVWMDPNEGNPYYINLGDPTESGVLELVGMHVVPDEIPELPDFAVESISAEDMLIFTGYEKVPAVTVAPFNATCQDLVLNIADESIVEVTSAGTLLALSAGQTEVTAVLEDEISGQTYETSFTVTVMDGADNLYGHLLTDIATMGGQAWIGLNVGNPSIYTEQAYFDYVIFTQEYVDGKLYSYGYDPMSWDGNWQYFIIDAATYEVETQLEMNDAFPFVYDMTYDHVTSTMYLLAGASEDNTDLYVANMETGEISLLMLVEPQLMAIAATDHGLFAIENSVVVEDDNGGIAPLSAEASASGNAMLYKVDPIARSLELVGDTGVQSNKVSSMTYDYDTDALYWTPFAQVGGAYVSGLAIVNTETGAATNLGTIGLAGAQVGGLYAICDEFPAADNNSLDNILMTSSKKTITVGQTDAVGYILIPGGVDAEIIWTSANENIATVDENGNVTGVAQGNVAITATATYNGVTRSATCVLTVLDTDAGFLTYNTTDGGWALINRSDFTVVTNLTEGVDEAPVVAIDYVGEDVYGYDVNGQLFQLNTETYERTNIGDGLGLETMEGYQHVVKDMAYDAANNQVLVLVDTLAWDSYWEEYAEIEGGCGLYIADLTTGELTQIYAFYNDYYVYAMDVDTNGNIYYYSTFNDFIQKIDTTTGVVSTIVSLQSQSIYGDLACDYTLFYDEMTDTLYLLFTSNNNFYKMVTIDASLGTLIDNGFVGEIVLEDDLYYLGDLFNGLTFANICEHSIASFELYQDEDGNYFADTVCGICGEVLATDPCRIISEVFTKEPTAEEDGIKVITVELPDGSTTEIEIVIPAGYAVARNTVTGETYVTVAKALAAAKEGETVELLLDCNEGNLAVYGGITLDLNGHNLTADYVVAFDTAHVVDTANTGKLIAGMYNVVLDEENAMGCFYDGTGYIFTKIGFALRQDTKYTGEGIKIYGMAYPVDMDAVALLQDGAADNNVSIAIRLTWDTDSGTASQEFVFNDDIVSQVYSSNKGTWNSYGRTFGLTVTGIEDVENLTATMMVISGTDASYTSPKTITIK